jgi:hypothetical protein
MQRPPGEVIPGRERLEELENGCQTRLLVSEHVFEAVQ